METTQQNQNFNRLWEEVGSNNTNRRIERAQNTQGRRAIKFKTNGSRKTLIIEVEHDPGFEVRLCEFSEKDDLVSTDGIVTFAAPPAETVSLEDMVHLVDQWASSFETIFGDVTAMRDSEESTLESVQQSLDNAEEEAHEQLASAAENYDKTPVVVG